ncbi:hypothetical protein SAMN05444370_1377 [Rubrimonas cliftonensis]|uniref:Uncharacterized protein n=1 Tax=Rubrimonas cliftonensis TaxID=89524 RepID=A0A1H4G582_9RHOB|nr:hypothetical protein SAMN05444370_1377 [Rubrimonas cliftonensis]
MLIEARESSVLVSAARIGPLDAAAFYGDALLFG